MIHILLLSHGPFCEGLLDSVEMISGSQKNLVAIPLNPGQSPDDYREKIDNQISSIPANDGLIVFCDLKGGTPYNISASLKSKYHFNLITGVNLPILISVLLSRNEQATVENLTAVALTKENSGIELIDLSEKGGKKHAKLSLNKNR
ncbi:MAG: PTS sugar transporter subunit IIA [Liquorilactobacillus satsumensis]|uniref:PTS sugar transporter subunit IIA n=1 Tax=Liquorilactobacillus TaxID=2767888 RepID=UPI0039EA7D93